MAFTTHFLSLLEFSLRQVFKYKLRDLIWPLIILPISWILDIILRGTYISTVDFYGKIIPYIYLLFLTFLAVDLFIDILNTIYWDLIYNDHLFYYDKRAWMLSNITYWLLFNILKIVIVFLSLHIFYNLSIKFLAFSILIGLSIVVFTVAFSLILSFAPLILRQDSQPLLWGANAIFYTIIPVSYALSIFPNPYRFYLEILLPFYGLIEEIRKIILLGNFNSQVLLLSVLVSVLYLLIGIFSFNLSWNYSRKTGKIKLA